MTFTHIAAITGLILATPLLSGAGCRSHYTARVTGSVHHDHPQHAGKRLYVIYRAHSGDATCASDWGACLLEADAWRPLRTCAESSSERIAASFTVVAGAVGGVALRHCTHMIGVDYRADIVAFIDLNGDGRPSIGEPYGFFANLTRAGEPTELPLEIRINRVLVRQ